MAVKHDPQQMPALLVIVGLGLFFAIFWWCTLSTAERRVFLENVRQVEEVERKLPKVSGHEVDVHMLLAEMEWLLWHRVERMQGMMLFLLQVLGMVSCEGFYRRRMALMSGFGLGMITAGRMMGVVWVVGMVVFLVCPVALPVWAACGILGGLLAVCGYLLSRGMPRVH